MLQQTRDNAASTHYMKSTGNKNCLAKLHLSRNDNESLKTNTRKKENYHRHHAASEEKWILLAWRFTATNHEARWCPRSKKINFSWKMMELKDTFSWEILHPSCFLFQSLFLCWRQTRFPSHFLFSVWISPQIAMKTFPTSENWRQQWRLLTKERSVY